MSATTTILGVTYAGSPMFRSLALSLLHLEQQGKAKEAQALLDAHNHIRKCFGHPPVNLAAQFTHAPMSMATCCPNALAALEQQDGFVPVEIRDLGNGRHRVAA